MMVGFCNYYFDEIFAILIFQIVICIIIIIIIYY